MSRKHFIPEDKVIALFKSGITGVLIAERMREEMPLFMEAEG